MKEKLWSILYNLEDYLEYDKTEMGKKLGLFINQLQKCEIQIKNKMNKRELVKLSAQGFIDNIYDQMRKENYPEDFQIAVINQIKNILK